MVVDISEINLQNLYLYQPGYRKKQTRHIIPKEKRYHYYKEYQHKYYLEVTKKKRIEKRGVLSERM